MCLHYQIIVTERGNILHGILAHTNKAVRIMDITLVSLNKFEEASHMFCMHWAGTVDAE